MFFLIITAILTIGSLAVTISLYESLKKSPAPFRWIVKLIHLSPLFSFAFNFGVSFLLTMFIGAGMISGAANLLASIIFAFYVEYSKKRDTKKSNNYKTPFKKKMIKEYDEKDIEEDDEEDIEEDIEYNIKKNKIKKWIRLKKPPDLEQIGEKTGQLIKSGVLSVKNLSKNIKKKKFGGGIKNFVKGFKNGLKH